MPSPLPIFRRGPRMRSSSRCYAGSCSTAAGPAGIPKREHVEASIFIFKSLRTGPSRKLSTNPITSTGLRSAHQGGRPWMAGREEKARAAQARQTADRRNHQNSPSRCTASLFPPRECPTARAAGGIVLPPLRGSRLSMGVSSASKTLRTSGGTCFMNGTAKLSMSRRP